MQKFVTKQYYEIEYGDFDDFVEEKLGKSYECVSDNEWSNYESHDFEITQKDVSENPESFFQKFTLDEVKEWLSGERTSIGAGDLLEYMAYKGMIPFGNYLITVFW